MRRESMDGTAVARRMLSLVTGLFVMTVATRAQAQQADQGRWRVGAAAGAYAPRSALIKSADANDTRLAAGPTFSLDAQYQAVSSMSVYADGMLSFGTIRLGSAIQPTVVGPSNDVMLAAGTAGVLLAGQNWLGDNLEPTLRLGAGVKWYSLDLDGATSQVRPTADLGVGFRSVGAGPVDVAAEIRYLPSSFDQAKLPIRGIAPQKERQNDFVLTVGFGIRP